MEGYAFLTTHYPPPSPLESVIFVTTLVNSKALEILQNCVTRTPWWKLGYSRKKTNSGGWGCSCHYGSFHVKQFLSDTCMHTDTHVYAHTYMHTCICMFSLVMSRLRICLQVTINPFLHGYQSNNQANNPPRENVWETPAENSNAQWSCRSTTCKYNKNYLPHRYSPHTPPKQTTHPALTQTSSQTGKG